MPVRVDCTPEAAAIIDRLRNQNGPLMFHQSGGCCDGSAPMCYGLGEFLVGSEDRHLGDVHGCPFFMSAFQFEYWKHTQLTLGISPGRGASFSMEIPLGVRFVIHSRVFSMEEFDALPPATDGETWLEQQAYLRK